MTDSEAALAILNRLTAIFAENGVIDVGPHLRATETLTLTLSMSKTGKGRLNVIDRRVTEDGTTEMLNVFEAKWTQKTVPTVSAFTRGRWEQELMALDS